MKYLTHRQPRLSNDLWGDFDSFFNAPSPFMPSLNTMFHWDPNDFRPAIDLFEDDSNYFVQAELPGFNRKEIQVELENGRLVLKGERKEGSKENEREISFHRSVTLPDSVNPEGVSAKYENGVLTVTIPKSEAVKPKRIEVQN